jgi:hypothetical protein
MTALEYVVARAYGQLSAIALQRPLKEDEGMLRSFLAPRVQVYRDREMGIRCTKCNGAGRLPARLNGWDLFCGIKQKWHRCPRCAPVSACALTRTAGGGAHFKAPGEGKP